jgi:hypothetical protein
MYLKVIRCVGSTLTNGISTLIKKKKLKCDLLSLLPAM